MSDWSDIGTRLCAEREALGQSQKDVSHRTRIPVQTLQQLEDNDYSHFPSAAYTKSFLAQYCEHLDIDATDWLEHFDTGNAFANLGTIGYLQGGAETIELGGSSANHKTLKRPAKKRARTPAPAPVVNQAPGLLQHLVVLTVTALFLGGGVYGFIQISDRIEQAAMYTTDHEAGSAPNPILGPAPSVVPLRPAPRKRPKALNNPSPAVAEVVSEGSEDNAPPALLIDAPPPRAVIIEE